MRRVRRVPEVFFMLGRRDTRKRGNRKCYVLFLTIYVTYRARRGGTHVAWRCGYRTRKLINRTSGERDKL